MMRKILSIALTVLITLATTVGCTQEKTNENHNQISSNISLIGDKLGDVSVEEYVTGELNINKVIITNGGSPINDLSGIQQNAEQLFQERFPNVKLNVENFFIEMGGENLSQYLIRLKTEIMSGKSPDVLFIDSDFTNRSDIFKMQDAGAFLDLSEFMAETKNINFNDYNLNIINAAKFGDKQYIMPLSYTTMYYASTEENLKNVGVDIEKLKTPFGVFEEANSYWKRNNDIPEAKTFLHIKSAPPISERMDIPVVDHQNKQVDVYNPDFKKLIELWNGIYLNEERVNDPTESFIRLSGLEIIMENQKGIGQLDEAGMLEYFTIYSTLEHFGTPSVTTLRDVNNKIQAELVKGVTISANSNNKENAWRFIECLLSKESQTPLHYDIASGTPVLKSVWEPTFKQLFEDGYKKSISFMEEEDYPAVSRDTFDKWVKEQDEISGLYIRTPMDYQLTFGGVPYWRGEKTYDECIESIKEIMEIYVSE